MTEHPSPVLTLMNTAGIGKRTVYQLWHENSPLPNEPEALHELLKNTASSRKGVKTPSVDELNQGYEKARKVVESAALKGIGILTIDAPGFPATLSKIPNPPVVLFWRGNCSALNAEGSVAVIGTRSPTEFGLKTAHRLGKVFAESGFIVVSGLALGCDAAAHEGCLEAHGKTIAILAHGLHRIYPKANQPLAERILENDGCLLSEYAPDVPARPEFFIERDRLQSGLGLAVVVVETDERGGSMHTIRFGCDQGKVIGAVAHPQQYRSDKSRGNERLIDAHQATALSDKDNLQVFISNLWERAREPKPPATSAPVKHNDDQLAFPMR
jgi:DNA processing protein